MPDDAEPKPDKRRDKSRGGCGVLLILALVVVLPALYVASIGPATWLVARGSLSQGAARMIYAPLIWLASQSQTLADWLMWYSEWWVG